MRSSSFCMTMLLALVVILLASLAMTAARTEPVKEYLGRAQMRTFGEPSQLLGSDKDLVLLLVSKHLWPRGNWKCMKSRFVSTETTNVSFIREEHFWIPPHQTSNATSAPKPGNLTFRYDVIRNTSDYTKVNTTYITESKRPRCALWVVNTTLESPYKYRHCMFILFAICKTPIYNLYEYEREDCIKWGEPPE
ncbi:uncharacterized protein LOC142587630 isoform X2 [Dermacentor variabilis]|uniref:uncharacterized protein LOC142587630 isoform X2 n=1 Tax=Dermacentor variabilis TaxID=34621 RepID=UPI003F5B107A